MIGPKPSFLNKFSKSLNFVKSISPPPPLLKLYASRHALMRRADQKVQSYLESSRRKVELMMLLLMGLVLNRAW